MISPGNMDPAGKSKFRGRFFNVFSTPNKNRRNIDVEVEISTSNRRLKSVENVRIFRRPKCRWGVHHNSNFFMMRKKSVNTLLEIQKKMVFTVLYKNKIK